VLSFSGKGVADVAAMVYSSSPICRLAIVFRLSSMPNELLLAEVPHSRLHEPTFLPSLTEPYYSLARALSLLVVHRKWNVPLAA